MLRLIFWPVLAPSFLLGVGGGALAPVMVLAALELGATDAFAAAIVSLTGAVALLVTVPVGMTIDRLGDKRTMALATAATAALTVLAVVALAYPGPASLAIFVASLVLRTPAMVAWSLARQASVADTVPAVHMGQAMTALGGTMRAGNLVGPLAGAALLVWFPIWSVYVFATVTAILATALLFVRRLNSAFDAETQRSRASRTEEERAIGVRWGAVGLAGVAVATLTITRIAQPILIALWGVHLGWNPAQISLMVAVGSAIELVLMFPGGYLKDVIGRSPVLIICLVVYGAGFIMAPLVPSTVGFIAAVAVMSIGNGLGAGINMTIGADLSPPIGRARFLSIWAMFSQVGALGGPLAISAILVAATLPAAMFVTGGIAMAGAAWMAVWARRVNLPRGVGPRRREAGE
ncbi:MAG: MFS transporter [bacterium]|nr:MFS transporter [bacterium]